MVLSIEEFAKQVIKSFDDIRGEIAELKASHNSIEKKIDEHLKVQDAIDEYESNIEKKQNKRVYLVIALMGVAFTIYELTKDAIMNPVVAVP